MLPTKSSLWIVLVTAISYCPYFHTAVNGVDYSSVTQSLTFTVDSITGDVFVPISEDLVSEPLENFFADISLVTSTDRVTIAPDEATVTIVDDDGEYSYINIMHDAIHC